MHKPRSVRRGPGPAANGRAMRRPDAMSDRRTTPMRPPPHGRRSASVTQAAFTVPRPPPGPGQERPDAGRSPGSRVKAPRHAFPGRRPSGCPREKGSCVSLTAYSCRDSRGMGRRTVRTAFPIKPFRAPTRSRETARSRVPRDRYPALGRVPTVALFRQAELLQHERLPLGVLTVALEPAGLAAMPCLHVDAEQQRVLVGLEFAEFRYPLGRLVILHLAVP